MKVSVIGTGDLTKIPRFTNMKKDELEKLISDVGKLLAKNGHEIVIIPNRGVPTEVAKVYKENGGKKVLGIVPTKDKKFGIKHIEPYLHLIDEEIEVDSWYDCDGEIAASGDVCIVIGISPGIMREITVLKYHYRYLNCKTRVFWFKNTITGSIRPEIAEEIPINYLNSITDLQAIL